MRNVDSAAESGKHFQPSADGLDPNNFIPPLPGDLYCRSDLLPSEKLIYGVGRRHHMMARKRGKASWRLSQRKWGEDVNRSIRTVSRGVAKLVKLGLLSVIHSGHQGRTVHYALLPYRPAALAPSEGVDNSDFEVPETPDVPGCGTPSAGTSSEGTYAMGGVAATPWVACKYKAFSENTNTTQPAPEDPTESAVEVCGVDVEGQQQTAAPEPPPATADDAETPTATAGQEGATDRDPPPEPGSAEDIGKALLNHPTNGRERGRIQRLLQDAGYDWRKNRLAVCSRVEKLHREHGDGTKHRAVLTLLLALEGAADAAARQDWPAGKLSRVLARKVERGLSSQDIEATLQTLQALAYTFVGGSKLPPNSGQGTDDLDHIGTDLTSIMAGR